MTRKIATIIGIGGGFFVATLLISGFGAWFVRQKGLVYEPEGSFDLWYLVFLFLLATAMVLLLLRVAHGRIIFSTFFSLAMFVGIWFIADIFLPETVAIFAAAMFIIIRYLFPRVFIQNILVVLGIAGIAVSIGLSVPWFTLLVLAVILAVYDIIAVYGTKHMITMMRGLLAQGVIFALVIPERVSWLGARLAQAKPGEGYLLIGTGDIALPAMVVASLLPFGFGMALGAGIGAFAGFLLTMWLFLFPGQGKPMPALPPIVLGLALGTLISFLIQ
ncbi:MAG: presenilin family intramembrane aspartyl protease [bacterium]|nr:presenilin family intramembrane aspartyl protease [bacterium]